MQTSTFAARALTSKNRHLSVPPSLKHTESVRLSHDKLMSRGTAGVTKVALVLLWSVDWQDKVMVSPPLNTLTLVFTS